MLCSIEQRSANLHSGQQALRCKLHLLRCRHRTLRADDAAVIAPKIAELSGVFHQSLGELNTHFERGLRGCKVNKVTAAY